jgi:hypothetical protein
MIRGITAEGTGKVRGKTNGNVDDNGKEEGGGTED